jgi:hypothetical protein
MKPYQFYFNSELIFYEYSFGPRILYHAYTTILKNSNSLIFLFIDGLIVFRFGYFTLCTYCRLTGNIR